MNLCEALSQLNEDGSNYAELDELKIYLIKNSLYKRYKFMKYDCHIFGNTYVMLSGLSFDGWKVVEVK